MQTKAMVFKHPYMWYVIITWGTREQMLENNFTSRDNNVEIGGSFMDFMNKSSRAALVQVGVHLPDNKSVQVCHWEGTYHYTHLFDDMIANGFYPIRVDCDRKTYIKRGKDYELTDTYRY